MIAHVRRFAHVLLILVGGMLVSGVLAGLLSAPAHAAEDGVLVLGRLSDDPAAHYEQLKPLLDYVVPRMADVGIREGRVLMARDAQQMASYMRRGRVDWVSETSGSGMLLRERAGAVPLVLTERDGSSHYHSVFFVRRDSGIHDIDELRGHCIAFQRPSSTSAYFVPAGELLQRGFELEILLSPYEPVNPGTLGYLFARSELNIATWVHKGLADAGVMSNLDWANPKRMPEAFRRDMRVIGQTGEYPRAVEMVRADMSPEVQSRLREVLIGASADPAAADPAAAEALRQFFRTTRFLPVDAESRRALERIQVGVRRVRAEVE